MRQKHESTDAERNAENDERTAHPPIHEQHPLSADEQRLIDESVRRQMNVGRDK
jgi:hypothetical protein